MSNRLKVGERYRLRSAKSLLKQYGKFEYMPHYCVEDMQKLLGSIVTIANSPTVGGTIYIEEDYERWTWHPDYFEVKYSELNERI